MPSTPPSVICTLWWILTMPKAEMAVPARMDRMIFGGNRFFPFSHSRGREERSFEDRFLFSNSKIKPLFFKIQRKTELGKMSPAVEFPLFS